jgi:hypothetical protein
MTIYRVGKTEGMRPLARPRRRGKYGIRMDLVDIGWGGGEVEWIQLVLDRGWWRAAVNEPFGLVMFKYTFH